MKRQSAICKYSKIQGEPEKVHPLTIQKLVIGNQKGSKKKQSTLGKIPKVLCLKALQPVIVKKILQHFVISAQTCIVIIRQPNHQKHCISTITNKVRHAKAT